MRKEVAWTLFITRVHRTVCFEKTAIKTCMVMSCIPTTDISHVWTVTTELNRAYNYTYEMNYCASTHNEGL